MGASLAHALKVPTIFEKNMVSFVSLGDGSVNNGHFLSAANLAEYAKYRQFHCPTVFCISDNNFSISLRGYGWVKNELIKRFRMPVFAADGKDVLAVHEQTQAAVAYSRHNKAPCVLYIHDLVRRFGHAATDRQTAYMTPSEVDALAAANPLEGACALAVAAGVTTFPALAEQFQTLWASTRVAFDQAVTEPKITRRDQITSRTSMPLMMQVLSA